MSGVRGAQAVGGRWASGTKALRQWRQVACGGRRAEAGVRRKAEEAVFLSTGAGGARERSVREAVQRTSSAAMRAAASASVGWVVRGMPHLRSERQRAQSSHGANAVRTSAAWAGGGLLAGRRNGSGGTRGRDAGCACSGTGRAARRAAAAARTRDPPASCGSCSSRATGAPPRALARSKVAQVLGVEVRRVRGPRVARPRHSA